METGQLEEQKEKATKTLATMLDYLGLEASIRAELNESGDMGISVSSDEAGRIIGRKGSSLESLQLLLNRMMFRNDPEFPRITIDIDGYTRKGPPSRDGGRRDGRNFRGRRDGRGERSDGGRDNGPDEETLKQQALDAAKEVKRWGDPAELPPMNSNQRRIIHITLENDPEIQTESIGEGSMKKVVISLKSEKVQETGHQE